MVTAGIDLASQPKDTAVCVIDWSDAGAPAFVSLYSTGWTDDDLMGVMGDPEVDRVGIDAPFGWPVEFVTAVSAYRDHGIWPAADSASLRFRATERRLGSGLSPSLDQLVWVVLRCARLLDRCARENATGIDRTGEGRFVEVYPAAALERWDLSPARWSEDAGSYKGRKPAPASRRQRLMNELVAELSLVVALPHEFVEECVGAAGDHILDAFVAALVARAMGLGNCESIPAGARRRAESEGWIRLPHNSTLPESVANLVPA